MTWVKLDDGISTHRKARRAGLDGLGLFAALLCYCGRHLTDGMVPKDDLDIVWPWDPAAALAVIGKLIDAGLLAATDDAWVIRDYLEYQPGKDQVLRQRDAAAQRARRYRENQTDRHASRDALVTRTPNGGVTRGGNAEDERDGGSDAPSVRHASPSRPVPSRPVPRESTRTRPKDVGVGGISPAERQLIDELGDHQDLAPAATLNMARELIARGFNYKKGPKQIVADIQAVALKATAARLAGQVFDIHERLLTFVSRPAREERPGGHVPAPVAPAPYHAPFKEEPAFQPTAKDLEGGRAAVAQFKPRGRAANDKARS